MRNSCTASWLRVLRVVTLALFATLALPPTAIAATDVTQTQEASIQRVLGEFYKSYIALISEDREPAHAFFAKSVSAELLRKIKKLSSVEGGLGADYFLDAQDYLDEWKENIVIAPITVAGNRAKAVVSLGLSAAGRHQLSVDLVRINHQWKITKVRGREL